MTRSLAPQRVEGVAVAHATNGAWGGGEGHRTSVRAASGRQAVAALVAARLEDGSPCPGGHAMPEAVSLRSFADVWLIGALHCFLFCGPK
jgi:hypothetical protein